MRDTGTGTNDGQHQYCTSNYMRYGNFPSNKEQPDN
jgi:hypothetical protein